MNDVTDRPVSLVSYEEFQECRQRRHNRASCGLQTQTGIADIGEMHVARVADCERGQGPIAQSTTTVPAIVDIK